MKTDKSLNAVSYMVRGIAAGDQALKRLKTREPRRKDANGRLVGLKELIDTFQPRVPGFPPNQRGPPGD